MVVLLVVLVVLLANEVLGQLNHHSPVTEEPDHTCSDQTGLDLMRTGTDLRSSFEEHLGATGGWSYQRSSWVPFP